MKKILFSLLAAVSLGTAAQAQTKPLVTAKIYTPSVQCEMCADRIETHLKRIDGVRSVTVAVKKKETTVKYLTDRTDIEVIKASIANAGYDVAKPKANPDAADEIEIAANPDYYKLLPKCCKKPEDGGGKPKQ